MFDCPVAATVLPETQRVATEPMEKGRLSISEAKGGAVCNATSKVQVGSAEFKSHIYYIYVQYIINIMTQPQNLTEHNNTLKHTHYLHLSFASITTGKKL